MGDNHYDILNSYVKFFFIYVFSLWAKREIDLNIQKKVQKYLYIYIF